MDHSAFLELTDTMKERQQMFSVLSRLLGVEVTEDLLETLKADKVFATDDESLGEGIGLIEQYLASPEASKLDLDRDYAKAFCGAGSTNRDSAYPFESFYTSKDRMLMQDARDDAVKWYRVWGLQKDESWHDCEDHVGIELEFMAHLIDAWLTAVEEGDDDKAFKLLEAQRGFEREHLANWLPLFAKDAQNRCRTDFYKGLTLLASAYVAQDLAALDSLW